MRDLIAQTTSGPIRGFYDGEVAVFKGVPYGTAERFQAPQPPAPWTAPRDCLDYGPTAPQPANRVQNRGISPPPPANEGEDCLVLNVWTRGLADGGKRPVMVWIHGGGFNAGSGSSPVYDGANLCRRGDVVSISLNHRLGVLGHLYLKEIAGGQFPTSGVNSFLDLVLALEWVRDNAEAFGGDPDRVMIFGESGGGGKVATLMTMPGAKGLFHRAAIQSGIRANAERPVTTTFGKHGLLPEEGNAFTRAVLKELGLGEHEAAKLVDLPVEQLQQAEGAVEATGLVIGPVIDGDLFPRHPFDPDPAPTGVDVPLIIGCNGDEWFAYISRRDGFDTLDDEAVIAWSAGWSLGDRARDVVEGYRALMPDATPQELLVTVTSDHVIRVPSLRIADMRAQPGMAPVYFYFFTYDSPVNGYSVHALEIPFVFGTVNASPLTGDGDERFPLSAAMSDAWIAFARTGDPNHEGMPAWPVYDPQSRPMMVFDTDTRLEHNVFAERTRLWDGIL